MKIPGVLFRIVLFASLISQITAQHDHHDPVEPAETKSEKTYLVDEFGPVGHCELTARFDQFFVELSNKTGAQGYFIFYKSADALPARYGESFHERVFTQHLAMRNFDASRVTIVDGGFRKQHAVQLWIVLPGGEEPQPSDTVGAPTIPLDKTFLFDSNAVLLDDIGEALREFELPSVTAEREREEAAREAEYQEEQAAEAESEEDAVAEDETAEESADASDEAEPVEDPPTAEEIEAARFDWISPKFGSLLADRKDSMGVIIFYADDQTYDINRLRQFIEEGSKRIAGTAGIPVQKISVQFGGYRSTVTTDFWVVSKKGSLPVATPEERPAPDEIETETTDN